MLPARRTHDSWLPDIFNDFFDNSWMERTTYTAPAINVIENEKEYDVELAAPGLTKEDFKVHIDEDNNLHIEMEKKSENKEGRSTANTSAANSPTRSPADASAARRCRCRQDRRESGERRAECPSPEEGEGPAARYGQADRRPVTDRSTILMEKDVTRPGGALLSCSTAYLPYSTSPG